jgi:ectoine hydroxylase-related dioxygenase (phytanoyl-CoA dioxygenase family)
MKPVDPGYAIEQSCLSNTECDALIEALSALTVARSRAGARHLMRNPTVAELSCDCRLLAIARGELGPQAVPFRATLFEKSGTTNWLIPWHQDTALPVTNPFDAPGWTAWSEKGGIVYVHAPNWALRRILALRIHLDACMADNGPLRVFPGSHTFGVLTDREVADYVERNAHSPCLVSRGGVLAMRPLLIHSSSKASNADPRRVLHIEYADSLDLSVGIRLAVV